ncbi:MAG: DUF1622 domain-containing protein [Bacillota bacterium]
MELLFIEEIMHSIISVIIYVLEAFGVIVVSYGAVFSFYRFIRTRKEGREIRLSFAYYIVFALEFKLASEILKTVIARSLEELYTIGAIIILRAALNYMIHWEIEQETYEKEVQM